MIGSLPKLLPQVTIIAWILVTVVTTYFVNGDHDVPISDICKGKVQNASLIVEWDSGLNKRTVEPTPFSPEMCTSLSAQLNSIDDLREVGNNNVVLPNLRFYTLWIFSANLSASEFAREWSIADLTLFSKSNASVDIDLDVATSIYFNRKDLLSFSTDNAYGYLRIDYLDPTPILANLEQPNSSFGLKELSLSNLKLSHLSLDSSSADTLTTLKLNNVEFSDDSQGHGQTYPNLTHFSFIPPRNLQKFDLGHFDGTKVTFLYVANATLTYTNAEDKLPSLNMLFLKDCAFDSSFTENAKRIYSNLTSVGLMSSALPNPINPDFLSNILDGAKGLKFLQVTNFDRNSTSSTSHQERIQKFLENVKWHLDFEASNFTLRHVGNLRWRGWRHNATYALENAGLDHFKEWSIFRPDPEPSYPANHIEIKVGNPKFRLARYMSDGQGAGLQKSILSATGLLPFEKSWDEERNISLNVNSHILLNIGHGHRGEKEISINRLDAVDLLEMLKQSKAGTGKLKTLALKDVTLNNVEDLMCTEDANSELQQLVFKDVGFIDGADMRNVSQSCGGPNLKELVLQAYFNNGFELDLTTDLKAKNLRSLSISGCSNLAISRAAEVPYTTLEELYIQYAYLEPSFLENLTKFFPNLKRLSFGDRVFENPNPILLKSILEGLPHVEYVFVSRFEWNRYSLFPAQPLPATNAEIENFLFKMKGDLVGTEKGFILQKSWNGEWIGKKRWDPRSETDKEADLENFTTQKLKHFYKDFSVYIQHHDYENLK